MRNFIPNPSQIGKNNLHATLAKEAKNRKESQRLQEQNAQTRATRVARHIEATPAIRQHAHASGATRRQERRHDIRSTPLPPRSDT